MKKKLPALLGIGSVIAFLAIAVWQGDVICRLRESLRITTQKLKQTESALYEEVKRSTYHRHQYEAASDSIKLLQAEIADLLNLIASQEKIIRSLNEKLRNQELTVARLTKEIQNLRNKEHEDEKVIRYLTKQRDEILVKMEENDRIRTAALQQQQSRRNQLQLRQKQTTHLQNSAKKDSKDEKKQAVEQSSGIYLNQSPGEKDASSHPRPFALMEMNRMLKHRQQERLQQILSQTTVTFQAISLRSQVNANNLRKISGDNWRYTFVNLDLQHPNPEVILNEVFVLQIFDLDRQQVVPLNEKNPAFPESQQDSPGYKFRYDGQPVCVRHFNSQRKQSTNYELRLLYCKNTLTFPLQNARIKIVHNKQVENPTIRKNLLQKLPRI